VTPGKENICIRKINRTYGRSKTQETNFALKITTEFNLCGYIITKHSEVFKLKMQRDHTRHSTEYRHLLLHFGKLIKAEQENQNKEHSQMKTYQRQKNQDPGPLQRPKIIVLPLKCPKISKLWMFY
jgi:hypothetical protein